VKLHDFPQEIRDDLLPRHAGRLCYRCLGCAREYGIDRLLYVCPDCGQVLLLYDLNSEQLKNVAAEKWRHIFDYRRMINEPALKGIYRYHEFIGPVIPLAAVVYLGEGHTPQVEANAVLQDKVGIRFYFKNDGQNPSASFKDRGMASALSYIEYMLLPGIHRRRRPCMHPI
jgi:threonine synthase